MKLNFKKHTQSYFNMPAGVFFSALFAVFSMKTDSYNYEKSFFVEKIANQNNNYLNSNLILQNPIEENKWANQLKKDINKLKYDNYHK